MHPIRRYLSIPRPVLLLLAAELLVSLVQGLLILIFNIFLRKELGYDDATIAAITSYRFLGVLALALPAGMMLKGRRLKPVILLGIAVVTASTWLMIAAGRAGNPGMLAMTSLTSGIGMMLIHVAATPFIIRETDDDTRTEALALGFGTWSLSLILCGLLVPWLASFGEIALGDFRWVLDEAGIIQLVTLVSLAALPLVLCIRERPPPVEKSRLFENPLRSYDWGRIIRATTPNLFIAVGAGLTIPFMNLFFNSVYGYDSEDFSRLGGVTGVLVLVGALLNPVVKRRFGYNVAIILSQTIAVFFLVLVGVSQILHPDIPGMVWLAAVAYCLRQPFMNMAQPITSELTMTYVGERNRELMSALGASIWSGSWFVSAKIFQWLRTLELEYYQIFFITAGLYVIGIALYRRLIRLHENALRASHAVA